MIITKLDAIRACTSSTRGRNANIVFSLQKVRAKSGENFLLFHQVNYSIERWRKCNEECCKRDMAINFSIVRFTEHARKKTQSTKVKKFIHGNEMETTPLLTYSRLEIYIFSGDGIKFSLFSFFLRSPLLLRSSSFYDGCLFCNGFFILIRHKWDWEKWKGQDDEKRKPCYRQSVSV